MSFQVSALLRKSVSRGCIVNQLKIIPDHESRMSNNIVNFAKVADQKTHDFRYHDLFYLFVIRGFKKRR